MTYNRFVLLDTLVIDQFHKYQNAPVPYPTMLRNEHISVLNGALWETEQAHSMICELGQLIITQIRLNTENVLCVFFLTCAAVGSPETNLIKICFKICKFSSKKMLLKISAAKVWPFCEGLNVLTHCVPVEPCGHIDLGEPEVMYCLTTAGHYPVVFSVCSRVITLCNEFENHKITVASPRS